MERSNVRTQTKKEKKQNAVDCLIHASERVGELNFRIRKLKVKRIEWLEIVESNKARLGVKLLDADELNRLIKR